MTDHYETLGVAQNATPDEIKKAYRALAKKYHPDQNPDREDAEARFKEITAAYETLSDPEKRAAYDNPMRSIDPGDIFSRWEAQQRNAPQRGSNTGTRIEIDFMDAVNGCEHEVSAPVWNLCEVCEGERVIYRDEKCSVCNGKGEIVRSHGDFYMSQTCPACRGKGKPADPCEACQMTGYTQAPRKIKVTIPSGVDNGNVMRLAGQGRPGLNGGPSGDLLVQINVTPHKIFQREGSDIHVDVPISYATACLGGNVIVPTLEGNVDLVIPVSSPHGRIMRLMNKGLSLPGRRPGQQYCHITIELLENPSDEVVEALHELDRAIENQIDPDEE